MTRLASLPATAPPRGNNRPGVKTFGRSRGVQRAAHRLLPYGTGGIGKTSLAARAPGAVFADLEGGSKDLDVERADGIANWADLRAWLNGDDFTGVQTIVIDTATTAEEWCRQHVIANVKTEKGQAVTSLEGYGYGKGYVHLFEEWKRFLADLERHYLAGRNIVLIAHERIAKVPNPNGEDYIRYEPRLHNSEKASIMLATKEWCDHVLFVSYDVVAQDGKARGSGTRTIYAAETATYMAKSRTLPAQPIVFNKDSSDLWNLLGGKPAGTDGDLPPGE